MTSAREACARDVAELESHLAKLKADLGNDDIDIGEVEESIHAMRGSLDRIAGEVRKHDTAQSDRYSNAIAEAINETLGKERYDSVDQVRELAKEWDVTEGEAPHGEALRFVHRTHPVEFAVLLAEVAEGRKYRIEARPKRTR